jgi:hypothetical protein
MPEETETETKEFCGIKLAKVTKLEGISFSAGGKTVTARSRGELEEKLREQYGEEGARKIIQSLPPPGSKGMPSVRFTSFPRISGGIRIMADDGANLLSFGDKKALGQLAEAATPAKAREAASKLRQRLLLSSSISEDDISAVCRQMGESSSSFANTVETLLLLDPQVGVKRAWLFGKRAFFLKK